MTHLELAKLIDTMNVEDSKAPEFMGKNVRMPSLVPGTLYIMKEWSTAHHVNYSNPYRIVEFVGSGHEVDGVRTMFTENPQIKTMVEGDYYWFKGVDSNTGVETYEFGAFMSGQCVCITSSSVRITCFSVLGHESVGFDTTPKSPRMPREHVTSTKSDNSRKLVSIDRDDVVIEDEDDGLGCPDAVEVHPISLIPFKKQREART